MRILWIIARDKEASQSESSIEKITETLREHDESMKHFKKTHPAVKPCGKQVELPSIAESINLPDCLAAVPLTGVKISLNAQN